MADITNEIPQLLSGQTAVVTGGAAGIGAGISQCLAAAGARVLVVDRDIDSASRLMTDILACGGKAQLHCCDIRQRSSVESMVQQALSYGEGKVDILVNNVGDYFSAGLFCESSEDNWDQLYNINLLHVLRCTHGILPSMRSNGKGSIINVSSVEAYRGIANNVVYSVFKAGVSQFTRALAVELGNEGIRVNGIAPDVTQTPQLPYDQWVPVSQQTLIPSWIPLGRFGRPADHGSVALFLASEMSSFITGHTIPVDGGTLASSGWFKRPGEKSWTNRPAQP